MVLALPDDLRKFVQDEVASGRFPSAEDVIYEALRRLREHERQLDELRAELQIGIDQLDRGESVPFDPEDIKRRGRERLAAEEYAAEQDRAR